MADTTKDNVLAIAPELCDVSPTLFKLILNDVKQLISKNIFESEEEMAQRYLAAHLLTVLNSSSNASGAVISEKIKDHTVKYGNLSSRRDNYDTTIYGRFFKQIKSRKISNIFVGNLV